MDEIIQDRGESCIIFVLMKMSFSLSFPLHYATNFASCCSDQEGITHEKYFTSSKIEQFGSFPSGTWVRED